MGCSYILSLFKPNLKEKTVICSTWIWKMKHKAFSFERIHISQFVECFLSRIVNQTAFLSQDMTDGEWVNVGMCCLVIFPTNMRRAPMSRCGLIEFGWVQSIWFSARSVTDGNKIALTVIKTLEWAGLVNGLHYPAVTSHLNKHIWCSNQCGFWCNQFICSAVNIHMRKTW